MKRFCCAPSSSGQTCPSNGGIASVQVLEFLEFAWQTYSQPLGVFGKPKRLSIQVEGPVFGIL